MRWKLPHGNGFVGLGGNRIHQSDVETHLTFDLEVRASHLNAKTFSQYQQFPYHEITGRREKGWTLTKIADWFNENGFATVRGKRFKSSHAHSIVKKKRVRDDRLTRRYEPRLSNFGLRFVERTLINQVSPTHPRNSLSDFPYEKPDRHSLPDPCRASGKCGSELMKG